MLKNKKNVYLIFSFYKHWRQCSRFFLDKLSLIAQETELYSQQSNWNPGSAQTSGPTFTNMV